MKYRKFEGREISEIGMGCYALSGAYGPVEEKTYKKVLEHAVDLGVNFFDTADTYGPKAERTLGEVINKSEKERRDINVQTKVGITKGGKPDLSYEHVLNAFDESLIRLDLDYIDYYLVHFNDPDTPVKDTLGAMEDLKSDGKIRGYGVGHLSMESMKEYQEHGELSVALMELNAVARGARQVLLPFCRKHDIGAFAFSVTGRGILTGKFHSKPDFERGDIRSVDPLFQPPRLESAHRTAQKMKEVGEKYGRTPVQVAIRWVLSQKGIVSALTGPSSKVHLEENVGGTGWEMNEDDLESIEEHLREEEEWLKEREVERIKSILSSKIKDDPDVAFSELIFAIESSIKNGLTCEKEVLPTFQRLWSMRKKKSGMKGSELDDIRKELKNIILD